MNWMLEELCKRLTRRRKEIFVKHLRTRKMSYSVLSKAPTTLYGPLLCHSIKSSLFWGHRPRDAYQLIKKPVLFEVLETRIHTGSSL